MFTFMVGLEARTRRRWIGAALLITAMALLVAGETILKQHLEGMAFLLYWLVCLLFTAAAMIVAFADARAVQHKSRKEARELIEKTLGKIESDVRQKPQKTGEEET